MIPSEHITGLVLAGGRGARLGGADKGLELFNGRPLALQALQRLQPQVATALLSANRNLDTYRSFGVTVLTDPAPDYPGPLAGVLAGLRHGSSPWLAVVPCDAPGFPLDLVDRLAAAVDGASAIAGVALVTDAHGTARMQPVFCLLHASLEPGLTRFIADGGRRFGAWLASARAVGVAFDAPADAGAFANLNTPEDLKPAAVRP